MVMDAAEPRNYDIKAICMRCGQARSKKVLAKPENEEAEQMAFLLEITSSHEHKDMDQWAVDWEEVN